MENTGRIKSGINGQIKSIVFGDNTTSAINDYLRFSCQVDKAHLVMLHKLELVDPDKVSKLLKKICQLEGQGFNELRGLKIDRGAFTMYEDYLMQELGPSIGGILQYGRSRNDLNATVSLLKFRSIYVNTCQLLLRISRELTEKAAYCKHIMMPAYTHYQPAVPISYGHWLAGIAFNLNRVLVDLFHLNEELNLCPLGSCAVGGTDLAIDNLITADLLGFSKPFANSVDAVASRNWVLRFLSSISIVCSTVSRVTNQLLLFSTQEFGFFELPDELVGGSSLMPNKRNPFILEHITGKCGQVYGTFSGAIAAMHNTLYSNSIAVSQESIAHITLAAKNTDDALKLLSIFIEGARPIDAALYRSNKTGFTQATTFANKLVVNEGISFREAHKKTGALVSELSAYPRDANVNTSNEKDIFPNSPDHFMKLVNATNYGGGPGEHSILSQLTLLQNELRTYDQKITDIKYKWDCAVKLLEAEVQNVIKQ